MASTATMTTISVDSSSPAVFCAKWRGSGELARPVGRVASEEGPHRLPRRERRKFPTKLSTSMTKIGTWIEGCAKAEVTLLFVNYPA